MSQIENAERQLAQDKQQANQYAQKLDSAETIQCLVDTRFEQLDKAIAIDLWQVHIIIVIHVHHVKAVFIVLGSL